MTAAVRAPRSAFRRATAILFASIATISLHAADLTVERARFELAIPLGPAALPPGPYLVSGVLEHEGAVLGAFRRIPRLHVPCPKPPCAAIVQAEIPFKGMTDAHLCSFLDGKLELTARSEFKTPGSAEARQAAIPIRLDPATLGLESEDLEPFARITGRTFGGTTGEITFTFLFINPFSFPATLRKAALTIRPIGSRTSYPLSTAPDLALPPGETEHAVKLKLKAEDILVLISTKVLQEQYSLSAEARVTGTLTVEIAGRTVELELP